MNYLVLGSAGQIGSPLCNYLRSQGHNVFGFDILNGENEDLRIYRNSLLSERIATSDFVFFLAFDVGGSRYLEFHQHTFDFLHNNVSIMENVFHELNIHQTPFIFASSQMSNMTYSPYGLAKAIGEKYTDVLRGLVVKFWNVYAPEHDEDKAHVITDFIQKAKKNNRIDMLTDGQEVRQFLHGYDCSKCLYTLSQQFDMLDKQLEYHITSFEWISIQKIAQIIAGQFPGTEIIPTKQKDGVQRDKRNEPDPSILRYWQPEIGIKEGIVKIIEEMK